MLSSQFLQQHSHHLKTEQYSRHLIIVVIIIIIIIPFITMKYTIWLDVQSIGNVIQVWFVTKLNKK